MRGNGFVRTASVTASQALLVGERTNRSGLIFYAPSSGSYTVSDSPTLANGGGIFVASGMSPVVLDGDMVGDLVHQALYVVGSGAITIGFIEVLA